LPRRELLKEREVKLLRTSVRAAYHLINIGAFLFTRTTLRSPKRGIFFIFSCLSPLEGGGLNTKNLFWEAIKIIFLKNIFSSQEIINSFSLT
jgi:hypothetical protein